MPTTYPPGSRFRPTRLGLVQLHLTHKVENKKVENKKVEKGVTGFIKTLNVYGDAPWLLPHDMNPLYCRNEWYYFFPRTVRGAKTVNRMVPGNGENFLGGTWKSTGTREDIMNSANELVGYRRVLVFNKNVVGKSDKEKTDWHMDEYSLHRNGDEYHDLVLCHIRLHSDERFRPHVPAPHQDQVDENNDNDVVFQNQEQQEAGFAMPEYEGGDVNQEQEQEEEQEDSRIPVYRPFQSNYNLEEYLPEAIAYQNDRGYLNQHQQQDQEHYPLEGFAHHGAEDDTTGYELMPIFNEGYHQQEEQQEEQEDSPIQSNYNQGQHLLEAIAYQNDRDYLNQLQQDQEDSLNLPHPLFQSNDNQEHYPLEDIAYHGAKDDTTGYELMPIFNEGYQQHEQQQEDSSTLLLPLQQSNDKQEHHPLEDIAFDGTYDDNDMFDIDDLLGPLPPLQSNDNNGQRRPSWNTLFVPSQVENKDNDNNTVLPNQEQQEAGFANQNDMTMTVEKEHGDVKQQDQEQLQKDLLIFLLDPECDDLCSDGAEDDWIMKNMNEDMKQQLRELEEELSKLMEPVPQPQDSGVHADQVMPKYD